MDSTTKTISYFWGKVEMFTPNAAPVGKIVDFSYTVITLGKREKAFVEKGVRTCLL